MKKKRHTDGGYYAIKGFIYQFDKSLLEVLADQAKDVLIEQIQDLSIEDYYIQVKYKESQKYTPSKIKKPVIQLIECFLTKQTSNFVLYVYFADKTPQKISLSVNDLDNILGSDKKKFTLRQKQSFVKIFTLEFAQDYEAQFKNLVQEIKKSFGLASEESAIVYHATFRANLLEIATRKNSRSRIINFRGLKSLAQKSEKIIFETAYIKFLKNKRYLTYLKKEYFTFRRLNIPNKERLIVLEISESDKDSDVLSIINNIQNKYFKKDISPAPYISLLTNDRKRIIQIKQKLWDKNLKFSDGTYFNGDKFRFQNLKNEKHLNHHQMTFKILSYRDIQRFKKIIEESYIFLVTNKYDTSKFKLDSSKEFYLNNVKDILKIIP